jgi:tetratricopeptide (TPR) repeat protein
MGAVLAGIVLSFAGCGSFDAQTRNTTGVQLYQQAKYQEAIQEFQEATYSDPQDSDGYYNLAATYHRIGKLQGRKTDLDQAETYYNLCLDRNDNHADCYRGLAVLLVEEGRNDDAFRLLEGWTQRQPRSADAKVELARLNDEFGNRQVAKDRLVEALDVDPSNSRALTALGKIREDAGDRSQALANYQRSLDQNSQQPQVVARVAALQSATGTTAAPAGSILSGGAETRMVDRSTGVRRY